MSTMKACDELRTELVHKAAEDGDFRARLVGDPKGTIEDAGGIVAHRAWNSPTRPLRTRA